MAGQNDFSTFVRKNLVQLTEIDIPMKVIYSLSANNLITKGEYEELARLTVSSLVRQKSFLDFITDPL